MQFIKTNEIMARFTICLYFKFPFNRNKMKFSNRADCRSNVLHPGKFGK